MSIPELSATVADHRSWLQWTLWGLLMSLVMAWVARSRSQPESAASVQRLEHPKSTLIIGLVGFLFFVGIAVVSNVYANATTSWGTTAIFVGFALLALPVIGDYFAARHEVSDEGLCYGRLFGSGGFLRWTEVKTVQFSDAMKWFRVESRSGVVVRFSVMLKGLPFFAETVLRHVPSESIDKDVLPVLKATAEGNPPSVWGAPAGGSAREWES